MKYSIFDIEADGLLDTITKIHCLSYETYIDGEFSEKRTLTKYEDIVDYFKQNLFFIGHNIIRYDIPAIETILGITIKNQYIDTLGLSWYLYPYRKKHGLEWWGEDFGISKPEIEDWNNLSIEEYIHRCEEDVKINSTLFHKQYSYLSAIYSGNDYRIQRLIGYLNFKLECLRDQEEVKIKLDTQLAEETKLHLEWVLEEKMDSLINIMPESLGKVIKTKPTKMTKKDGTPSILALRWYSALTEYGLPLETEVIRELPNPASPTQLKEWLKTLNWEPQTFKISKATKKEVPQVSLPFGQGICPSVQALYEDNPGLEELENLYMARHRLGLMKSFLKVVDKNGYVYSTAHGFTNTLRLQHMKPIANLPGVYKPYGKEVRGCLKVPSEEYLMCGSDISGLEDNTKQHYIYFFDPQYVTEMRVPNFDPHIDIALVGEMITEEDAEFFKAYDESTASHADKVKYKEIKNIRTDAKTVNFSATYGAGPAKIAETLKKPLEAGKLLHETYWKRNAAIKKTADACVVKTFYKQKWLYNPVSGFWMFLKEDKDKFSTLNQSTGVYVFDTWVRKCREFLKEYNIKICMQYHDEILLYCKAEQKTIVEPLLKQAMKETNVDLNLNVEIGISVDWGTNYAECH